VTPTDHAASVTIHVLTDFSLYSLTDRRQDDLYEYLYFALHDSTIKHKTYSNTKS